MMMPPEEKSYAVWMGINGKNRTIAEWVAWFLFQPFPWRLYHISNGYRPFIPRGKRKYRFPMIQAACGFIGPYRGPVNLEKERNIEVCKNCMKWIEMNGLKVKELLILKQNTMI